MGKRKKGENQRDVFFFCVKSRSKGKKKGRGRANQSLLLSRLTLHPREARPPSPTLAVSAPPEEDADLAVPLGQPGLRRAPLQARRSPRCCCCSPLGRCPSRRRGSPHEVGAPRPRRQHALAHLRRVDRRTPAQGSGTVVRSRKCSEGAAARAAMG